MESQFQDGDPRQKSEAVLERCRACNERTPKEAIGAVSKELVETYTEVCKCALSKTAQMEKSKNPFLPTLLYYLNVEKNLDALGNAFDEFEAAFKDTLITVVHIRALERVGGVKDTFNVELVPFKPEIIANK